MLTRRTVALAALGLCALAVPAVAAPPGVVRPVRLTGGPSNQMLGVLGPGGRLFYVDDEGGPLSIKSLEPQSGAGGVLLDDAADATAPRPSRDGRRLLYVSYQTNAAGQLCVREFDAGGRAGERRCLSDEGSAVYQAEWLPDGGAIAALVRTGLGGDYALLRYPLQGGAPAPLLPGGQNHGSPAISPDGRWLAYVPLKRVSEKVSPTFASDAARTLQLVRLDAPGASPVTLAFELPGASGFPAFSADGRFLYFTQFLNDTTLDGVIDGNDHGVIFRVAFDGSAAAPVDVRRAEQLTSAEWNCQYPAPAADRLVATCLFEGSLHVYSLPLEGAVPAAASRERLDDLLSASRGRWERLLLLARRAAVEPPADHPRTLLRMIELHLALGELESSEFYTGELARPGAGTPLSALAPLLTELIAHRRGEAALARGELSEQFVAEARARLTRLAARQQDRDPAAAALARLVASEAHDVLGEREEAARAVAAVPLEQVAEPFVLRYAAERAAAAGRDLESREPLLAVYRRLAAHPALEEADRLELAERYVLWRLRGLPRGELAAQLEPAGVDPAGELGFRLELERRLSGLTPQGQEEVRAKVFELYRANKGFARRKALVEATVRRAAREDADALLYQFADTWVSFVRPEQAERRPAEDLYRQVVLERAYIARATGNVGDARGHFFGVTLQTDSLEAHTGFVEQRLREGKSEAAVLEEYQKRYAAAPDDPAHQFVQAWLLARGLPELAAEARVKQAARAQDLLRAAARGLWARWELQLLWGYAAHQRFLAAADRGAAEEAIGHYRLALDLAREAPRGRAAALSDLALLQSAVGNFAIALGYFEERDKLPFIDPLDELRHRLEKARALFHVERRKGALRELGEAQRAVARPELSRFKPLVLDRAALYHLEAGRFPEAKALYQELLGLLAAAPAAPERTRSSFAALLGKASAGLGAGEAAEALADLQAAQAMLGDAAAVPPAARDATRLLVHGLKAQTHAQASQWEAALAEGTARRDLLAARQAQSARDEGLLDLALVEAQLSEWSLKRQDGAGARAHLEAAFARADAWSASTGTAVFPLGLELLDAAARLSLDEGLSFAGSSIDLAARLAAMQDRLCRLRNPEWAAARGRITAHLARLELARAQ